MKKIFGLIITLMMISANCFAMTFSQPVKIGSVSVAGGPSDGIKIDGATSIKDFSTVKNVKGYTKGIARFGNSLYFYFNKEYFDQHFNGYGTDLDRKVSRFGGTDVKNTAPIFTFEGNTQIYRIKNDGGIELYLAQTETGGGGSIQVFGKTKEGKWVRYFNTNDARKSFGIPNRSYIESFFMVDDEIILQFSPGRMRQDGELRYKWDDKAQWFGVEYKTCTELLADMRKNPSNYYAHGGGGTGLSFWVDKNSVHAQKTSDGCVISVRSVAYYCPMQDKISAYYNSATTFPVRFSYNFKAKKIYAEMMERDHSTKWEYVSTTDFRYIRNILPLAECAFYLAYNRNFFDKPFSYRDRPVTSVINF